MAAVVTRRATRAGMARCTARTAPGGPLPHSAPHRPQRNLDLTQPGFGTALVVAPQLGLRRSLLPLLRGCGVAQVLEAETGAEALSLLGSTLVQLVLTTWELPDMAGRPLLQALRNHGRNRDVPLVLLDTGLPRATAIAAVKAGAAGRIAVPPEPGALRGLLAQIAAERPASAQPRPTRPQRAERPRPRAVLSRSER